MANYYLDPSGFYQYPIQYSSNLLNQAYYDQSFMNFYYPGFKYQQGNYYQPWKDLDSSLKNKETKHDQDNNKNISFNQSKKIKPLKN